VLHSCWWCLYYGRWEEGVEAVLFHSDQACLHDLTGWAPSSCSTVGTVLFGHILPDGRWEFIDVLGSADYGDALETPHCPRCCLGWLLMDYGRYLTDFTVADAFVTLWPFDKWCDILFPATVTFCSLFVCWYDIPYILVHSMQILQIRAAVRCDVTLLFPDAFLRSAYMSLFIPPVPTEVISLAVSTRPSSLSTSISPLYKWASVHFTHYQEASDGWFPSLSAGAIGRLHLTPNLRGPAVENLVTGGPSHWTRCGGWWPRFTSQCIWYVDTWRLTCVHSGLLLPRHLCSALPGHCPFSDCLLLEAEAGVLWKSGWWSLRWLFSLSCFFLLPLSLGGDDRLN
jgi:hypothetical protein